MIRWLRPVLAACLLLAAQAAEAFTPAQRAVLTGVQGWTLPGTVDLYFARNGGACAISRIAKPCSLLLANTNSTGGYVTWADGHVSLVPANTLRMSDLGLFSEGASTNIALWNRDLTNANWTASNATVAKDQLGVDNAANAASSITATANNATVTAAAITSASASRIQSWYLKRLIGTGTVSISQDGGTTYTDVSGSLSGAVWFRGFTTQTVTNPQLVIKLGTSGDKVAVDLVQLEATSNVSPSSPIATTTVAVTRSGDLYTLTGTASAALSSATAVLVTGTGTAGPTGVSAFLLSWNDVALIYMASGSNATAISNGTNTAFANPGTGSRTGLTKAAFGMDSASFTAVLNGGTLVTQANAWAGNAAPVYLGSRSNGGNSYQGYIQRLVAGNAKGQFNGRTQ